MEISNLTKKRILDYLSEEKRFDDRKLFDYRDVSIELGISKNAEGSARVKLGNTEVMAGVKLDIGEPYPDSEDSGVLITTAELLPMSSAKYEPGPPKIDAIELARIVDRGIRASGFLDFKKLCIKKKEKVWSVFLDIFSINDDGNLIDASFLASVAALINSKMPKYNEKDEKVEYGKLTNKNLPLSDIPIMFTFHKIGDIIFIDPITEEEEASEARLSIALTKNKDVIINAIQKGKEKTFLNKEVMKIIEMAGKKFDSMYEKIKKMIK